MSLTSGTRLGHYEIVSPLGAGGMGEVYRATDSRLKRPVAVKILPAALAGDPDRLARFQREAEVLASLNHPHIAAIYRLEDAGDVKALVMELVEGPTLAHRIEEGPLPLDEALPIARQIAEALEAAHERGIIHRDLKPANIKVREDGTVKVLDFGLAKLAEASAGRADTEELSQTQAQSPTLTSPGAGMTSMGVVLGTATYMSPEQARGRAVDKRTDVWAFGAVLYEMLTGARAFDGEDTTEIIAAVVKATPDWTKLPAETPPQVVTLIQRCLEKDRTSRISDIAVARFLLSDHAALAAAPVAPALRASPAPPRAALPPVLLALAGLVITAAVVGWMSYRRPPGAQPVSHLQMALDPAEHLPGSMASVRPARTAMAISPDGRTVVFAGARGDAARLHARALDRAEATPLTGTEGAAGPFFSPDGAWIGFWIGNTIKKVPAGGGPPAVVADVPARAGSGASWGEDGWIYFESSSTGISRVPAAGGSPTSITRGSADAFTHERHLLPHALPGGSALLFTVVKNLNWDTASVVVHPLEGGERRVLVEGAADARYVGTGHLAYVKNGTLMAVPFDLGSRQITGAPVALIENVMQGINAPNDSDETGAGQFDVSASGTLIYLPGGLGPMRKSSMVWVDRRGAAEALDAIPPGPFYGPRLSPDGQRIAVAVRRSLGTRDTDLWLYDITRGAPTRLTFDGGGIPIWSPDGKRLVYSAGNLRVISADGSSKPEALTPQDDARFPTSWAAPMNTLAFLKYAPSGALQLWTMAVDGDRTPRLFTESPFELHHPAFSPDGRLVAYVSTESGTPEIYVQPYPGPGEKIRVSTAGGFEPIWTANSRELLFRSGTYDVQQVFAAAVRSLSPFRADAPRLLFAAKAGTYDSTAPERSWDVTADGQRFLMLRPTASTDRPVTAIQVVLNWTQELTRLVPAK